MEKRRVGKTQLEIDVLGLGGAPLGGNFADLNYAQGVEIVSGALDAGMSYFDTAPWYGFGRSERVVGDQLRGKNYILSSKVGRLLVPGAVTKPMDFGMIDPLPFHPVYDYSYDGVCVLLRMVCKGLVWTGLIFCWPMTLEPFSTVMTMRSISKT